MTELRFVGRAAGLPAAGGTYSHAVVAEHLLAVSGQVGRHGGSGQPPDRFADEVALAIGNLEVVLLHSGSGLAKVVKTSCFLTDMSLFAEFDAVYRSIFADPYPARTTVGVALAGGLRFEIDALAVLD